MTFRLVFYRLLRDRFPLWTSGCLKSVEIEILPASVTRGIFDYTASFIPNPYFSVHGLAKALYSINHNYLMMVVNKNEGLIVNSWKDSQKDI